MVKICLTRYVSRARIEVTGENVYQSEQTLFHYQSSLYFMRCVQHHQSSHMYDPSQLGAKVKQWSSPNRWAEAIQCRLLRIRITHGDGVDVY